MQTAGYPRIANLFGLGDPTTAYIWSRYALLVVNNSILNANPAASIAAVKSISPSTLLLPYVPSQELIPAAPNYLNFLLSPYSSLTSIPTQWYMAFAGATTLSAPLNSGATSFTVASTTLLTANYISNPFILIDNELMVITSISGSTVTVTRGNYNVTPVSHTSGASVVQLSEAFNTTEILMNVSPYCPVVNGQKWSDFLPVFVTNVLAAIAWDGIFYDNVGYSWANITNGLMDANNDGSPDGGDGPSGSGWSDGELAIMAQTRTLNPTTLIIGNGITYPGMNGQMYEGFPTGPFGSIGNPSGMGLAVYLASAAPIGSLTSTIINIESNTFGGITLKSMRYNLGITLLANGYYSYDFGPSHGDSWWFDEYDNAAGSSVAVGVTVGATTVTLVSGTGSKFSIGDIVSLPDSDTGRNNDETVTITNISGDVLTVTPAFAAAHAVPSKVFTQAQLANGVGWLGQPIGNAINTLNPSGANVIIDGSFESASVPALNTTVNSWLFANQAITVYSGTVFQTTVTPIGTLTRDTSVFIDGTASARFDVSVPVSANSVALYIQQINIPVTINTSYVFSIWVKAATPTPFRIALANTTFTTYYVTATPWATTTWSLLQIPFTTNGTTTLMTLDIGVGLEPHTIWIDGISIVAGVFGLYRRDFQGGSVFVNTTPSAQTVSLDTGYHYLSGTQDQTHNPGGTATSVTIQPSDALLLRWQAPASRTIHAPRTHRSRGFRTRVTRVRRHR